MTTTEGRRRILVTNDDGYDAAGLTALAAALDRLGEVVVVAPASECSAIGQGFTLAKAYRAKERSSGRFSVEGTPVDCVMFATAALGTFDLLVSGINRGANLGWDVWYSGTVGAALEGARRGLPSLAVSIDAIGSNPPYPYAPAADRTARYLEQGLLAASSYGGALNLNFPCTPPQRWAPLRLATLSRRVVNTNKLRVTTLSGGTWELRVEQERSSDLLEPDADAGAVHAGAVLGWVPLDDVGARADLAPLCAWAQRIQEAEEDPR